MKRTKFLFGTVALVVWQSCGGKENPVCPPRHPVSINDAAITSQVVLDSLTAKIGTCTRVDGSLNLKDVQNLADLSSLREILGDLIIEDNPGLKNLEGLNSLSSVSGNLIIRNNDALENLDGLASLNLVKRNLTIQGNDALKNLDGLANLQSVGRIMVIADNGALTDLDVATFVLSQLNSGKRIPLWRGYMGRVLSSVCNGRGITGASPYNPGRGRKLLLTKSIDSQSTTWDLWNDRLPDEWSPVSFEDLNLVGCIES